MKPALIALLTAAALAGCGRERNTDVGGFVDGARTPAERAILTTIATYRTTEDEAKACRLATRGFIDGRFEGEYDNCEQVVRTAPRYLPDKAKIASVKADSASIEIDEPTSTRSIYEMRREGGTWKIDDIVQPP